ncbi:MAG: hypothetical protein LBS44_07045, partial [Deltaproteobacteria bacterium]|nr:hypothetical protein [Deltaproteobacteria bacterium]
MSNDQPKNIKDQEEPTLGSVVSVTDGAVMFKEVAETHEPPLTVPSLEKERQPEDLYEEALSKAIALKPRLSKAEKGSRFFFLLCAILAMGQMLLIMIFLFTEAAGMIFSQAGSPAISLGSFLFGSQWYPTYPDPSFGALALISGSLAVTVVSTIIAAPLGLGLAIFLSCIAGRRTREWVKPAVELLASIPSVVLGLVGMVVIAPFLQETLNLPTG